MILRKDKEIPCASCPSAFHRFFTVLDKADLQYLADEKEMRSYRKGHHIYEESHKSYGIYCLKEGQVKVYRMGKDGREQITRIVFPGEFLGLRALISGNDHTTTATTLEDSVLCFIGKNDFFQMMIKYPDFSRKLIQELSHLLDRAETRLMSMSHRPVKVRLAEALLFLQQSFHNTAPSYPRPYLNLSRLDLANIIGTTPESVIRLLSGLKDERILAIKGRKITILDPPRLEFIANSGI